MFSFIFIFHLKWCVESGKIAKRVDFLFLGADFGGGATAAVGFLVLLISFVDFILLNVQMENT